MELAEPSIFSAFKSCVELGATKIICHPYFLSRGRHVTEDIPALVEEAAQQFQGVEYIITEPLGTQAGLTSIIHQSVLSSLSHNSNPSSS